MSYQLRDSVWVYSNGSYYAGNVVAIGPKRVGVQFVTGSGKAYTRAVNPDADLNGYRLIVPGTEPKPASARSKIAANKAAGLKAYYARTQRKDGFCTEVNGELVTGTEGEIEHLTRTLKGDE